MKLSHITLFISPTLSLLNLPMMKKLTLNFFWHFRLTIYKLVRGGKAIAFNTFWFCRSAFFRSKWKIKRILLQSFWLARALAFRAYWFSRSAPHRLRFFLRIIFYKYLFKFRLIKILRNIAYIISTTFFKLKVGLLHSTHGQLYQLASMQDFSDKENLIVTTLEKSTNTTISGPRFLGRYAFKPIATSTVELKNPAINIYRLANAKIIGGTNFICTKGYMLHPDVFIPPFHISPAELNGIITLNLKDLSASLYSRSISNIDCAISLLGPCTGNYAHWLTETLPKVVIANSLECCKKFPFLVDQWIHPNFLSSIKLLDQFNRDIIRVPRWATISIESLIEISPAAHIPPEHRYFAQTKKLAEPNSADFPFSMYALNLLRNSGKAETEGDHTGAKKLYLYRAPESCGNMRQVINIKEVEKIVKEHGYTMLDPAKLSFKDQIVAFSNARKIISPLGAALANTIFSPPGCKIVGLSPYYPNANYYFFSNLMGALGHEMYYVLGEQKAQWGHPAHKNFEVDMAAFEKAILFLAD